MSTQIYDTVHSTKFKTLQKNLFLQIMKIWARKNNHLYNTYIMWRVVDDLSCQNKLYFDNFIDRLCEWCSSSVHEVFHCIFFSSYLKDSKVSQLNLGLHKGGFVLIRWSFYAPTQNDRWALSRIPISPLVWTLVTGWHKMFLF